jgi:hypothetical protein
MPPAPIVSRPKKGLKMVLSTKYTYKNNNDSFTSPIGGQKKKKFEKEAD